MKTYSAIAQVPPDKSSGRACLKIHEERMIRGDIETLWRIVTDVKAWPTWDPHEEAAELRGGYKRHLKAKRGTCRTLDTHQSGREKGMGAQKQDADRHDRERDPIRATPGR